jgi:undecaprenyl-phosphate 4-deoxy-4-formamido-L-arabinose transferase
MTTISVVIPVYRSADSLPELLAELARVLPTMSAAYEVVLVDDASPDDSWRVIQALVPQYPFLRAIQLMRNYGQHNALLCGIRAARFDVIVTMDDDLQHPPDQIPALLAELDKGYDVVYGAPEAEQHGLLRDLASQVTKWALQGAMGVEIARKVGAFRVFRTALREAFTGFHGPLVNIDVLLTWGTTRFSAVAVSHQPRKYGQSNYTFRKLVRHALNMITGFTVLPLQVASLIGFLFFGFGMLVLIYVVGRYLLEGTPVEGFPFLASIIALFAGAQLFALGIIGEYLARMYLRSMDRPVYTVRTTLNPPGEPAP